MFSAWAELPQVLPVIDPVAVPILPERLNGVVAYPFQAHEFGRLGALQGDLQQVRGTRFPHIGVPAFALGARAGRAQTGQRVLAMMAIIPVKDEQTLGPAGGDVRRTWLHPGLIPTGM